MLPSSSFCGIHVHCCLFPPFLWPKLILFLGMPLCFCPPRLPVFIFKQLFGSLGSFSKPLERVAGCSVTDLTRLPLRPEVAVALKPGPAWAQGHGRGRAKRAESWLQGPPGDHLASLVTPLAGPVFSAVDAHAIAVAGNVVSNSCPQHFAALVPADALTICS